VARVEAAVTHALGGFRRRAARMSVLPALAGCAGWVGRVGVVAPDEKVLGVKLLRPRVMRRACASSLLGFPLGRGRADLDEAMAALLARDGEANVLTNVELRRRVLVTGVYNRRCVEVRGDLGRTVTILSLPVLGGPESHR